MAVERRTRAWRAGFGTTLALGMAAATASQFLFGVLGPYLVKEFDISRAHLGVLTMTAFLVGGIGSPVAGRVTDRIGGRKVFLGSLVAMAGALLGIAAAPLFPVMVAAAAIAGIGLASCNPTTNKLLAEQLAFGERGVITGVKQAGVQAGAFLIGFGVPPLATRFGWRAATAALVTLPALAVVGALRLIPPDPARPGTDRAEDRGTPGDDVRWLTAYAVMMGAGVAVIGTYLPLYAEESLGFSVRAAGALAGTIGIVGVFSRIVWGWGSERLAAFALPLAVMAAGAAVATALLLVAPYLGPWALWVGAILLGTTAVTWNAVAMLAIVSQPDSARAGRISGIVLAGFYLGFVLSPVLFGLGADRTESYATGWSATLMVFLAAGAIAIRRHASATT